MKKAIKIILFVILGIVVLIGLLFAYSIWQDARANAEKNKVVMTVKYNIAACSEEYPLLVLIENNSSKTVNSIDFNIAVHRKGYSSDLADWGNYDSDKIIPSGQSFGNCWRYKLKSENERYNNPADLEFVIDYKYVQFQN